MREHLCQILAHYVLYFRWRLNLPIPHDAEPFILKGASSRWHKKGVFQWKAAVEDKAELDAKDWPAEEFLENNIEGRLNSVSQGTGFPFRIPLCSRSKFECNTQLWPRHATSSRESFHTWTNIAPTCTVDPSVSMSAYPAVRSHKRRKFHQRSWTACLRLSRCEPDTLGNAGFRISFCY
jgi:hypothetical protein